MVKIVLDPGHGGSKKIGGSSPNNAVGQHGLLEKTVTLAVALRAEGLLVARGHAVTLTRRSDVNVGLADRARAAKSIAAPVFVSIHLNGFNRKAQGTETICDTDHSAASAALCRAVQKRMVAATGYDDRNKDAPGGVKSQPLGVLKRSSHHARTACCLTEISFMDLADEETRLGTEAYRDRIAQALSDGIVDYVESMPSGLEAAADSAQYEDGFAALAAEAAPPLESARPRTASRRASRKPGRKPQPDGTRDLHEFSKVPIGDGEPRSIDRESLELPGFDAAGFAAFIEGLGLRYFEPQEFLFLGASNASGACAGKNGPPPAELWRNVGNTALMLDEIRHRVGYGCRILSAYRSPAYNTCIGGEDNSFHMRFNAIDFRCSEGTPAEWHAVAKAVRASDPRFKGGIGRYDTFIHIDTRGQNRNW